MTAHGKRVYTDDALPPRIAAQRLGLTVKQLERLVAKWNVESTPTAGGHRRYSLKKLLAAQQAENNWLTPSEVGALFRVRREAVRLWTLGGHLVSHSDRGHKHYLRGELPAPFNTLEEPPLTAKEVLAMMGKDDPEWLEFWKILYHWTDLVTPSGVRLYVRQEVMRAAQREAPNP